MTKAISTDLLALAYEAAAQKREYDRKRQAAYRETKKNQMRSGSVVPNSTLARDVLADLAVMMIATGAPGSETLMSGLAKYFKDRPGFPMQIVAQCRSGKLRPKIVK